MSLQQLSCDDLLRRILDYVGDLRADWEIFGLQLGLQVATLKEIKADASNCSERLTETLIRWLREASDDDRNYKSIARAASKAGHNSLAQNIADREKFSLGTIKSSSIVAKPCYTVSSSTQTTGESSEKFALGMIKSNSVPKRLKLLTVSSSTQTSGESSDSTCSMTDERLQPQAKQSCQESGQVLVLPRAPRISAIPRLLSGKPRQRGFTKTSCSIVIIRQTNKQFDWISSIFGEKKSEEELAFHREYQFTNERVPAKLQVYDHVLTEPSTLDRFLDEIPFRSIDLLLYCSPLKSFQKQKEVDNLVFKTIKSKFHPTKLDVWNRTVFIVTCQKQHLPTRRMRSNYQASLDKQEFMDALSTRQQALMQAVKNKHHFAAVPVIPVTEKLSTTSAELSHFYKLPDRKDWFNDMMAKMLPRCGESARGLLAQYFFNPALSTDVPHDDLRRPPQKRSVPLSIIERILGHLDLQEIRRAVDLYQPLVL